MSEESPNRGVDRESRSPPSFLRLLALAYVYLLFGVPMLCLVADGLSQAVDGGHSGEDRVLGALTWLVHPFTDLATVAVVAGTGEPRVDFEFWQWASALMLGFGMFALVAALFVALALGRIQRWRNNRRTAPYLKPAVDLNSGQDGPAR